MKVKAFYFESIAIGICLLLTSLSTSAQVVVDSKDVTADKGITYIQLLYFIDKTTFKPVYLIDYGLIENPQSPPKKQTITIEKTQVSDSMSPMFILNLLYKSGWEYLGDETYVKIPLMEDWYSFTLRRKK